MTQKEKLEEAKRLYQTANADQRYVLESLFPELKESEEERMLKFIKNQLFNIKKTITENYELDAKLTKAIEWLEKQSEQKPNSCDGCINRKGCINCENGELRETEQKPIDKVESKFNIGDWIVDGSGFTQQVLNFVGEVYICTYNSFSISCENNYRLWTIADAKEGDVLVYNNSLVEIILLFKKWMNGVGDGAYSYAHTFNNEILFNDWSDCGYTTHPATKEQRDHLFEKMKEAGYEWDEEKKQLKMLEKQGEQIDKGEISDGYHTFNELYYYRMLYNAAFFNLLPKEWTHKSKRHHDGKECFGGGWFIVMANLPTGQISNHYELKDWDLFQIPEKEMADEWDGHTPQEAAERLHKYLEKQAPKPKWSEEDSKMIETLIAIFEVNYPDGFYKVNPIGTIDMQGIHSIGIIKWLKSLKQRMGE